MRWLVIAALVGLAGCTGEPTGGGDPDNGARMMILANYMRANQPTYQTQSPFQSFSVRGNNYSCTTIGSYTSCY